MKAIIYGFSLKAGSAVFSLEQLYQLLLARSGQPDNRYHNERRIYVDATTHVGFLCGLVVTVRDQRAFMELIRDRGTERIGVSDLKGKNKLMETNLFVIRRSNGIGIYQHYFQSCSVSVFGTYLQAYYNEERKKEMQKKLKALEAKGAGKAALAKLRKENPGGLSFAQLTNKAGLEDILNGYPEIRGFEYEFADVEAIKSVAAPISKFVRRRVEKLTFRPDAPVGKLASAINSVVTAIKPRAGRVHVRSGDDELESINIARIPRQFGEKEFDDLVAGLKDLELSSFAKNKQITELVKMFDDPTHKTVLQANFK